MLLQARVSEANRITVKHSLRTGHSRQSRSINFSITKNLFRDIYYI